MAEPLRPRMRGELDWSNLLQAGVDQHGNAEPGGHSDGVHVSLAWNGCDL